MSSATRNFLPEGDKGDNFIPKGDNFIPKGDNFIPKGDNFIPKGEGNEKLVQVWDLRGHCLGIVRDLQEWNRREGGTGGRLCHVFRAPRLAWMLFLFTATILLLNYFR